MKRSSLLVLYAVTAGLALAVTSIASLTLPTPAEAQAPQLMLCEHLNYGGRCLTLSGNVADLRTVGFNDLTTSVRVPAGSTVALYEHLNYGGRYVTVQGDVADLRAYAFNDTTTSVRIGAACDLVGKWRNNLNYGVWTITGHSPAGVWGTYTWSGGGQGGGLFDQEALHTTGERRLHGRWRDQNGSGRWDITFSPNCRGFSGSWGWGNEVPKNPWYGWKE